MAKSRTKPLNVTMATTRAQGELLRSTSFKAAFVGGFGSGKTRGAVYKAIQLGFLNAPCCGYFVQPTYTIIRDTGIKSFSQIFDELGIPYKIHMTNNVITVADQFEILLRSGEEAGKIIGTNAGWGIIDEPGKQTEEVGKNVLARIRDSRAKLQQLVLTGTPEGFNWFYDWCNNKDTHVIRAKTSDNPFNSGNYEENLRSMYSEQEIRAYLDGEFVRFEGGWYRVKSLVYPPIQTLGLIKIYKLPQQVSDQLLIGLDTGGGMGRDSTAIAVVDKRDKTIVATWKSNSATVDQASEVVQQLHQMYTRKNPVYYEHYEKPIEDTVPMVLIEMNGIGLPAWQDVVKRGITAVQVKTSEGSRYACLLETKKGVENGTLVGPEELAIETEQLIVENGKFKGPKDLSMAIGFCLNHINGNPYRPPKVYDGPVFRMKLGSDRRVG